MSFSINTNVASLQAQNYLAQTSNFQSKTIGEVTSGLRIVNSGDDAAGLAIANGDRSTEAVLTQGLQNATNGQNQLQIADGGMSSIGSLLDTARSLATESASGTFTGDRTVLNTEFQSVLTEINRQAQAIGLNQGGSLATNLSVFIGGGQASSGVSASSNGSVGVDLSQATVDAKSLGLEGVQASGATGTDIGTGSTTSVANILTNSANQASISNNTTNFTFTGPGFANTSGGNTITLAVNLNGVTDTGTLTTAVNAAIQAAGNGNSQQATAFKNANITAAISKDASGKSQMTFNSASTAFQVQGGDQVATALLGNFSSGSTGNVANVNATGAVMGTAVAATVGFNITGSGLTGVQGAFNVTTTAAETIANVVAGINTAIAGNATLAATGITATLNGAGTAIQFTGKAGQSFQVQSSGDATGVLGFGSFGASATSFTAAGAVVASKTQGINISLNGGANINLGTLTGGTTELAQLASLNTALSGNAATSAAGLTAIDNAGKVEIVSSNGTSFRMNTVGGTGDAFGFGASTGVASTGSTASAYAAQDSVNSAGAQQASNATGNAVYQFTGLTNHGDAQTVTLSAVDASGAQHTLNVNLNTTNASTLDQATATINSAIASSNDTTLENLGAFKQEGTAGNTNGVEGMSFMSAAGAFKVSLGASPASSVAGVSAGIADGTTGLSGGAVFTSSSNGTGSTADISNIATATAAVAALATSVSKLGSAQAAVGEGENSLTYAINLASSQLTNLAASESSIRDANMATESANLTKSQIQLQAGIAALSQANSAPQQILTLLQH
jgi:flagellin